MLGRFLSICGHLEQCGQLTQGVNATDFDAGLISPLRQARCCICGILFLDFPSELNVLDSSNFEARALAADLHQQHISHAAHQACITLKAHPISARFFHDRHHDAHARRPLACREAKSAR